MYVLCLHHCLVWELFAWGWLFVISGGVSYFCVMYLDSVFWVVWLCWSLTLAGLGVVDYLDFVFCEFV